MSLQTATGCNELKHGAMCSGLKRIRVYWSTAPLMRKTAGAVDVIR